MLTLHELQIRWKNYLLQQEAAPLSHAVAIPPENTSIERMAIYADAYMTRLVDVLEKNYPYLRQWLEEETFWQLAKTYLTAYPSRYTSVREIGKNLPLFLQKDAFDVSQIAYSEMAQLEWSISTAIDAANGIPLEKNALEKIDPSLWGNLTFQSHASLQILKFNTNILEIYQALIKTEAIPSILTHQTNYCRVWRKNLQVYYVAMPPAEAIFLSGVQQEKTFEVLCEELCDLMPEEEVVSYAINQLLRWLDDKLLIGITIKETP